MPKPTETQYKYLTRGLNDEGGKLPLFDRHGQRIRRRTIKACLSHGWSKPMYKYMVQSDWQFCRLTAKGRKQLKSKTIQ